MILSFMEKFPWKEPTYFEWKINQGIKKHTFRQDNKDRWKAGITINFYTGSYKKGKRKNFSPDKPCLKTEKVRFENRSGMLLFSVFTADGNTITTTVDSFLQMVAENDGFDTIEDMKTYFVPFHGDMWCGKCIHWTDLDYSELIYKEYKSRFTPK